MSRISNDLAGQIATKLTEKSRVAAEKLHIEFRDLVTKTYESQIPDEVKNCFKKNPDWFYTRGTIKLNGHGFNWEHVGATNPVISNSNESSLLKMSDKIAANLMTAMRKWQKAKEKYETLRAEAKQALLALKTFSNIRKELPEASSMLPPPLSNALVVNFTSLHNRLKSQPEINTSVETKK